MDENTIRDFVLPFKILISPLKTFNQIAQKPSAKGLVSLSALILVFTAATIYASATKIDLNINGQPTSFLVTGTFNGWFASALALTIFSIFLYWLVFASSLALISSIFRGKEISWRVLFAGLGYLLLVFVILYAVRVGIYLSLPSIYFEEMSSWPPVEAQIDYISDLEMKNWSPLYAYQFGIIFNLVTVVWLVLLGAIALRALRETSWIKAAVVSVIGFLITLFILGPLP